MGHPRPRALRRGRPADRVCGALAYLVATSDGLNDTLGRPLGTDFSNVYAAGTLVRDGEPQAPFDPARQYAREQAIFGPATPFYGWHYPPFFLLVAAALATMPYLLALAVWQGASLLLYLLALRMIVTNAPEEQPAGASNAGRAASTRTRCGFSWRWRFPRCSSISATATTAFSPRR